MYEVEGGMLAVIEDVMDKEEKASWLAAASPMDSRTSHRQI